MSKKTSRRELLINTAGGLGGVATLSMLLPGGGLIASPALGDVVDPLAPKPPHFPAKAKSIVWLHQFGAPSSLDLYDYKPELVKRAGQEVPASFLEGIKTSTQGGLGKLFVAPKRTWQQYGQSGAWFSNLLPNLSQHADELAFIKASTTIGATQRPSCGHAVCWNAASASFTWSAGISTTRAAATIETG